MAHRGLWDVGLVADDLTGASDSAVQYARRGYRALVLLPRDASPPPGPGAGGLLAMITDARALSDDQAADRTTAAVESAMAAGVTSLLVKIDSTMRGSVPGQVAGALRAWRLRHPDAYAVLCPAYPAMGRTVRDGRALLDGQALESGPPGRDPVTPVRTSLMSELVPGAVHVRVPRPADPAVLATSMEAAASRSGIVAVDAETDTDLATVADALARSGARAVPVGSAGLASALAMKCPPRVKAHPSRATTSPAGPVVVLVTSLHSVARDQERRLVATLAGRLERLSPALDVVLDEASFRSWVAQQRTVSGRTPDVVLVSAPEPGSAAGNGAANIIAARLADLVAELHVRYHFAGVVVTGGDGAGALVDRWHCVGVAVDDYAGEGVPRGSLVGGEADGMPIITKSGGFGQPNALVAAVQHVLPASRVGRDR